MGNSCSSGLIKCLLALIIALGIGLNGADKAFAAEKRIALVIGNADYQNTSSLPNSVNDARLIRDTLGGLGFEIVYRENATKKEMTSAIAQFAAQLSQAGSSGIALVYYAGHGIQSAGENYLLPVDAALVREADLRATAVSANTILAQIETARSSVKIIILDACRNNPFAGTFGGGAPKGLAEIGLGNTDFFVSYAATAGNVALDGDGGNSPYAKSIAARLGTPNSDISNTFRLVRVDVSIATQNKQLPEVRTTMRRQFTFAGTIADDLPNAASTLTEVRFAMKSPTLSNLVGAWCEASRGRGTTLNIEPGKLIYAGNNKVVYKISAILPKPDGRLEVQWKNQSTPMVFEFGEFDQSGQAMTQIRGRKAADLAWKEYFLRFKRCN